MQLEKKLTVEIAMELPKELAGYLSEGLLGMKVQFYWRSPVRTQYVKSAHPIKANLSTEELDALMDVNKDRYEH
jgi:hypothetical protein